SRPRRIIGGSRERGELLEAHADGCGRRPGKVASVRAPAPPAQSCCGCWGEAGKKERAEWPALFLPSEGGEAPLRGQARFFLNQSLQRFQASAAASAL